MNLDLSKNDELRLHRKEYFNYCIEQLVFGWDLKICKSRPKGWLFLLKRNKQLKRCIIQKTQYYTSMENG